MHSIQKNNQTIKAVIGIFIFLFTTSLGFSQSLSADFFTKADQFFKAHVKNGRVDYKAAKHSAALIGLINTVQSAELSAASPVEKKAFYINAYNLTVINEAARAYPLSSVNDIPGFFDKKKHKVANEMLTLNKLEKENLIKVTGDERLHFVLVCGALDCPPIVNFAYTPDKLDKQLEKQTSIALNNPNFIKVNGDQVSLSKIFQWYPADFGGNLRTILTFINKYRNEKIDAKAKIDYYNYNWQLNEVSASNSNVPGVGGGASGANAARYVVSAAIPKGSFEFKLFNNLYTQQTGSVENLTDRATFFTTTVSALYGVNNRFNAGFEFKYRRVSNSQLPSSALEVFSGDVEGSSRTGVTGIGPKVRIAPFEALENFSIQSQFYIPVGEDLAGNSDEPFIDWNGAIFWTQFFNDFSIGNSFSLFAEVDLLIEDIGSDNNLNRVSTPLVSIFSYFPNPKTTLYALAGFTPHWQEDFDYFYQGGFGSKYQFTPKFEIELLYTAFRNKFLLDTGGKAQTFNLGIRYNL